MSDKKKDTIQLIWGVALVLFGIGVFFRFHQVLPQIQQVTQSPGKLLVIRFGFYLMGILLLVGGFRKIARHFRPGDNQEKPDEN